MAMSCAYSLRCRSPRSSWISSLAPCATHCAPSGEADHSYGQEDFAASTNRARTGASFAVRSRAHPVQLRLESPVTDEPLRDTQASRSVAAPDRLFGGEAPAVGQCVDDVRCAGRPG